MKVTWLDSKELFPVALRQLKPANTVLDIGCGIQPQRYLRPAVHICCEPFRQYVDHLQDKIANEHDRNWVVLNATWGEATRIFPPRSVDTVMLVDVIEHLEKEEALELLRATEAIPRSQLAIFTPLGFLPQEHTDGKDAWGLDGAAWQEHKSGWQPEDFGEGWEIFVTKVFHTADNLGRPFETPFGAMWAIKTVPQGQRAPAALTLRKRLHRTLDDTLDAVARLSGR